MRTGGRLDATRTATDTYHSPQAQPLALFCNRFLKSIDCIKNIQIKYTFPCTARSPTPQPCCYNSCCPTGTMMHLSQPSSWCLATSLWSYKAPAKSRATMTPPHHPPVPARSGDTSLKVAGQPFGCSFCCHPHHTTSPVNPCDVSTAGNTREERWIDCYQSSRRPPSGWAAQAFGFGARSSHF